VYLAGLCWDSVVVALSTLLIAYAGLPILAERLLAALALVVLLSMLVPARVYMRTDLYYVLMVTCSWNGCAAVASSRTAGSSCDTWVGGCGAGRRRIHADLSARERRAVRVYAVAMAAAVAVALTAFATFGLPILVEGIVRAFSNLTGGLPDGDLLRILGQHRDHHRGRGRHSDGLPGHVLPPAPPLVQKALGKISS
jgi:hypothetical protein